MAKAFYAGKWPEEIDFTEAFHRMVAQSIREQNATCLLYTSDAADDTR